MRKTLGWYIGGGLVLIVCLSVLAIVTIGSFLMLPAHLHYFIEEKYSFSADEGEAVVHLGLLIPKSGPYQEVRNINISWHGKQEREQRSYVEVVKLSGVATEGKNLEATLSFEVILPKGKVSWDGPVEKFQCLPQHGIESDHPSIKKAVSQITCGSALEDVYKIYSYIPDYLVYTLGDRNCASSSALTAYLTHEGVCGEYARLMVAFSRANGVPAQMISGINLPDLLMYGSSETRIWEHPGESHAWVEFNTDGTWTMADPTVGAEYLKPLQFSRNDGHHLSYGEIEQEGEIYQEMKMWAARQGDIIGSQHAALKFVASANSSQVSITPSITVRKGWDGRWVNTLGSLILITFILCRLRNRFSRSTNNPVHIEDYQ